MRYGFIALALALVVPTVVFAQTPADERAAVDAALGQTFHGTFPYVPSWVVSDRTDPLPFSDSARPDVQSASSDYAIRNAELLDLSALTLPPKVTSADLTTFDEPGGFDWEGFENAFGAGTWTVRVARPGFADPSSAVVRIDVWSRNKQQPLTTVVFVTKQSDGSWRATGGFAPARHDAH